MAEQIFYWTGCVIWWGVCLATIGCILSLVIITALLAYGKSRGGWWRWYTIAKFAELGWTQDQLNKIALNVGGIDDDFLHKAHQVIEAGERIKIDS